MKITHDTDTLLIFDHVPWALSIMLALLVLLFAGVGLTQLGEIYETMLWLSSLMFLLVGGGVLLLTLELFAQRLQFIFDHETDLITFRRRSLFRQDTRTHPLSDLIDARIEQDVGQEGGALTRPVLLLRSHLHGRTQDTRVPLHNYYTSGPGPEIMVEKINTWLDRTKPSPERGT